MKNEKYTKKLHFIEDVISSHMVKFSNYGCRNLRLYFSINNTQLLDPKNEYIDAIAIPLRLTTENQYWFHYEFLIVQVLSNRLSFSIMPGNILVFRYFYFDQISCLQNNIFNTYCKLTTEKSPFIFDCGPQYKDFVLKSKWN